MRDLTTYADIDELKQRIKNLENRIAHMATWPGILMALGGWFGSQMLVSWWRG